MSYSVPALAYSRNFHFYERFAPYNTTFWRVVMGELGMEILMEEIRRDLGCCSPMSNERRNLGA